MPRRVTSCEDRGERGYRRTCADATALPNRSAAIAVVAHRDIHIAALAAASAFIRAFLHPIPFSSNTQHKHGAHFRRRPRAPLPLTHARTQASGVGVNAACLSAYEGLKLGRGSKPKYIVFTLSKDLTEIVVEKTGEPTSTYDEFLGTLPEAECRWAVYDFDYKREDGGIRNKLTFFSWYVPSLIPTHAHSSSLRAISSTLTVEQVGRGSGVRHGLSRDVTHTPD